MLTKQRVNKGFVWSVRTHATLLDLFVDKQMQGVNKMHCFSFADLSVYVLCCNTNVCTFYWNIPAVVTINNIILSHIKWVFPHWSNVMVFSVLFVCLVFVCVRLRSPDRLSWLRSITSSTQSAGNQPVRPLTVPSQYPPSPTLSTLGGAGKSSASVKSRAMHTDTQRHQGAHEKTTTLKRQKWNNVDTHTQSCKPATYSPRHTYLETP